MIKKGTIIVFAKESTNLRPELRGCRAKFTSDFDHGVSSTAHLLILNGIMKGREMQGYLKKTDYTFYILNKGK